MLLCVGLTANERVFSILHELHSELFIDSSLEELTRDRVVVLSGDLGQPQLGVKEEEFALLCETVDVVIHNGAVVNHAMPYAGKLKTRNNVQLITKHMYTVYYHLR